MTLHRSTCIPAPEIQPPWDERASSTPRNAGAPPAAHWTNGMVGRLPKIPPAGYPAFLQYLQSGRVRHSQAARCHIAPAGRSESARSSGGPSISWTASRAAWTHPMPGARFPSWGSLERPLLLKLGGDHRAVTESGRGLSRWGDRAGCWGDLGLGGCHGDSGTEGDWTRSPARSIPRDLSCTVPEGVRPIHSQARSTEPPLPASRPYLPGSWRSPGSKKRHARPWERRDYMGLEWSPEP